MYFGWLKLESMREGGWLKRFVNVEDNASSKNVNEEYIIYEQKKSYFYYFLIIGSILVIPFSFISHIVNLNIPLLIVDFSLTAGVFAAFILTKRGKLLLAVDIMLVFLLLVLLSATAVFDYLSELPVNPLRLLDTTLVLLPLSVLVGIFTTNVKKLARFVLLYAIVIVAHFTVLVIKNGGFETMLTYYLIWCIIILYLNYWIAKTVLQINKKAIEITKEENKKLAVLIDDKVQELAKANKTKDKFFSIIAHDLKGPISTSWQLTKLLSTDFENRTSDEIKRALFYISNDLGNLTKLMEELLLWSRSQSDKIKLNKEELNAKDIIASAILPLHSYAQNKNIEIEHTLTDDLTIFADKDMIATVFRNLVSNALKFTENGGKISLYKGVATNPNAVVIVVEDNGVGIDTQVLDNIFSLKRESTKGTNNESGTGLGLTLCKEFVEKNNGTISVVSKIGRGSSFFITLPRTNTL